MSTPLLQLVDLSIAFDTEREPIVPVRDVSFCIFPGQTVALVGESGCGKSVTALSIMRLIPQPPGRVVSGQVLLDGRDLLTLPEAQMRRVRGKDIAMIFQEPMTSLNPVFTIGDQIMEAIVLHQRVSRREAREIAERSLREVGIADPQRRLDEYPHQMSGGMRQRVMIAMALSCQPRLLIADEPTTALDVTIQAQILELLRKIQADTGMSILLITHDLGVVAENADVVGVMYASRIVEFATVEDLFDRPRHPYTQALFRSIPRLGRRVDRLETIPGAVPNPASFPPACKFHPRCALTRRLALQAPAEQTRRFRAGDEDVVLMSACVSNSPVPLNYRGGGPPSDESDEPLLREVAPGHWAACHFTENYAAAAMTRPILDHKRLTATTATAAAPEASA
jgi:oligopeptide/dipeptide ABC transporter ATP-binding protein